MNKFKIVKSASGYRVQFLYNSEIIFWTENYTSEANALNAISAIKENCRSSKIYRVGY